MYLPKNLYHIKGYRKWYYSIIPVSYIAFMIIGGLGFGLFIGFIIGWALAYMIVNRIYNNL